MTGNDYELQAMHAEDEEAEASAPLIDGRLHHYEERVGLRKRGPSGPARTTLRNAGRTIWILTLSAGISGLLFGYDTGVISSTLVSIGSDLSNRPLTTTDKSLITAITSLFALLSAPTTGHLAERYGRRAVILLACILFIIGAVVQAIAGYVWWMVVGRAVVGTAVGLASCATPLYITELAPAELRGRLVTIQSLFITGGQVVAYIVGWQLARLPAGWRWMVGLGAVPGMVQACLLVLMYETPRWLVKNEEQERARQILHRIYGGLSERDRTTTVDNVLLDIRAEIVAEAKLDNEHPGRANGLSTVRADFKNLTGYPPHRRALIIACMLQGLQQLCGFNSLMYFSATIFQLVNFQNPIGVSLSVAGTNFVFTLVAFAFIDTVGRRTILLYSIPFMIAGLGLCSVAFRFVDGFETGQSLEAITQMSSNPWPGVLVAAMMVYVSAYAIGLGCVPWQQSELFPLRVRALGSGLATATNWSSNFLIGISFLPMMNLVGATTTFAAYAIICVIGWIAVFRIYPETAGLELEGVGELLKDGFGVRESMEKFKAARQQVQQDSTLDLHDEGGTG